MTKNIQKCEAVEVVIGSIEVVQKKKIKWANVSCSSNYCLTLKMISNLNMTQRN